MGSRDSIYYELLALALCVSNHQYNDCVSWIDGSIDQQSCNCLALCAAQLLPESEGVERKSKFVGLRPREQAAVFRDFQPEVVVVVALGRKKCILLPMLLDG